MKIKTHNKLLIAERDILEYSEQVSSEPIVVERESLPYDFERYEPVILQPTAKEQLEYYRTLKNWLRRSYEISGYAVLYEIR